jgi:hypothetical protein
VIDRLRIFLNRPLGDADRRGLFVLAVLAIVAGAGAFALLDAPGPRERDARAPVAGSARDAVPAVPERASLDAPSEEGELPEAVEASAADVRAAKRAARRFLADYLRYTYGRGSASGIAAASDDVRERLAAEQPRVPAAERRRRPRVLLLQADGAGSVRARIVALVEDGTRRYTVPLELERRRSSWTVIEAGS